MANILVVDDEPDAVELVDIPPAELIERMRQGRIYRPDQADRALRGFFREMLLRDNLPGRGSLGGTFALMREKGVNRSTVRKLIEQACNICCKIIHRVRRINCC